jgi:hypothetical protein
MDTLQMVIVCNSIFRHVYLFPYETLAGHFSSALLTPSPEVMHQQVSRWLSCFFLFLTVLIHSTFKAQLLALDTLRPDGSSAPSTGIKRSHEYTINMDDFLQDVKKRRLIPSYDSRMRFNLRLDNNL